MHQLKKVTPIALSIAALLVTPAWANGDHSNSPNVDVKVDAAANLNLDADLSITTGYSNVTNVSRTVRSIETRGEIAVSGTIGVDSEASATIRDQQINYSNMVSNTETSNQAVLDGGAAAGSSGNIGVNVAAGDNNQQANAAALSATDAGFVFGSAAANVSARQDGQNNMVKNMGSQNMATLGGGALANASGNIGVNIASGANNQQKNDLAASTAVSRMANASVTVKQMSDHNNTINAPISSESVRMVETRLSLAATGSYAGISDQKGNQYPDIWTGAPHPGGSADGHFDLDTQTQGGYDRPQAAGLSGNAANDRSTGGSLSFNEAGDIALTGAVTGSIPVVLTVNKMTTNQATLGSGALANATGNVGVNIAAGTGNQQYNGLAIAVAQAPRRAGGE